MFEARRPDSKIGLAGLTALRSVQAESGFAEISQSRYERPLLSNPLRGFEPRIKQPRRNSRAGNLQENQPLKKVPISQGNEGVFIPQSFKPWAG